MSTERLFEGKDILAFLQSQVKPADQDPWLFVVIPETTDHWQVERFADILQPVMAIRAEEDDNQRDYDTRMAAAVERFARSDAMRRVRMLTGHFKVFQINEVQELSNARLLTILRDPLDRLLSDFSQQNANRRGGLRTDAFVEFAKSPANQNVYMQFLCPKSMWKPKDCVTYIQDRFSFIGIAEDQPMTMKMFYATQGVRYNAVRQDQESGPRRMTRGDLTPDLIKSVSTLNAVDYDIFRYFHDRFVSVRDNFFAMFDHDRVFEKLHFR
jgi:hypothetical protein